eukprot:5291468-Pyramimonas_sp.AAC.1
MPEARDGENAKTIDLPQGQRVLTHNPSMQRTRLQSTGAADLVAFGPARHRSWVVDHGPLACVPL